MSSGLLSILSILLKVDEETIVSSTRQNKGQEIIQQPECLVSFKRRKKEEEREREDEEEKDFVWQNQTKNERKGRRRKSLTTTADEGRGFCFSTNSIRLVLWCSLLRKSLLSSEKTRILFVDRFDLQAFDCLYLPGKWLLYYI